MAPIDTAVAVPSGPPDWEHFTLELFCPRCGYNLRMLTGNRCSECGLELEWDRIVDAARALATSSLFEHQWHLRPLRSLVHTIGVSLQPRRLWSRIPITLPVRPVPLAAIIVFLALLQVCVMTGVSNAVDAYWRHNWGTVSPLFRRSGIPWLIIPPLDLLAPCALIASVLIFAWLFLQIFRRSLTHWRVKQSQLFRVLVIAWIPMLLVKVLGDAIAAWWSGIRPYWPDNELRLYRILIATVDITAIGLFTYSVAWGLARYLQLRLGYVAAVAVVWLTLQTWATLDILYAVAVGNWSNQFALLTHQTWPGMSQVISAMLGLF
jgi:hypothetical protein